MSLQKLKLHVKPALTEPPEEETSERYYYKWGLKFRLVDGKLQRLPRGRPFKSGRFGEDTVKMSVPVSLVPFFTKILDDREKLVKYERAIQGSVLNTSPEVLNNEIN